MPIPTLVRSVRPFLLIAMACAMACGGVRAQSSGIPQSGRIYGTVTDSTKNVVVGADVTLRGSGEQESRMVATDGAGFFNFTGLAAGKYRIAITSAGFAPWTGPEIVLTPGEYRSVPPIALEVAAANTSVRVVFSSHALAEEQVHAQEKQRVLGIIPNFYTSYTWDAEPLSTGQKFRLAQRPLSPLQITTVEMA